MNERVYKGADPFRDVAERAAALVTPEWIAANSDRATDFAARVDACARLLVEQGKYPDVDSARRAASIAVQVERQPRYDGARANSGGTDIVAGGGEG